MFIVGTVDLGSETNVARVVELLDLYLPIQWDPRLLGITSNTDRTCAKAVVLPTKGRCQPLIQTLAEYLHNETHTNYGTTTVENIITFCDPG